MDRDYLEMLCCPVDQAPLRLMAPAELADLNAAVAEGTARHASGEAVAGALEHALVSASAARVYGVAEGVPALLPELAIVRESASPAGLGPRLRPGADVSTDERWAALSRHWDDIQPPIRPGPEDVEVLEQLVGAEVAGRRTGRPYALLLGVTPEIATMRWPGGTRLLALDFSAAMIRNVWRAPARTEAMVARANWTAMPVRDAVADIVAGDGNLTSLAYPGEYASFAGEIRRVLKDSGRLVLRLFARPERPESLDAIFADLFAGRIASPSLLPWRIAMALHRDLATGVRAAAVWESWCEHVPHPDELMRAIGWPPQALGSLQWARGAEYSMRFPTVSEVEALFAPSFSLARCHVPDNECGGVYPTVVLTPSSRL